MYLVILISCIDIDAFFYKFNQTWPMTTGNLIYFRTVFINKTEQEEKGTTSFSWWFATEGWTSVSWFAMDKCHRGVGPKRRDEMRRSGRAGPHHKKQGDTKRDPKFPGSERKKASLCISSRHGSRRQIRETHRIGHRRGCLLHRSREASLGCSSLSPPPAGRSSSPAPVRFDRPWPLPPPMAIPLSGRAPSPSF